MQHHNNIKIALFSLAYSMHLYGAVKGLNNVFHVMFGKNFSKIFVSELYGPITFGLGIWSFQNCSNFDPRLILTLY